MSTNVPTNTDDLDLSTNDVAILRAYISKLSQKIAELQKSEERAVAYWSGYKSIYHTLRSEVERRGHLAEYECLATHDGKPRSLLWPKDLSFP